MTALLAHVAQSDAEAVDGLFFGAFGLFLVIWLAMMALIVVSTVFWIIALVEVIRIPEHQYRAAGTDKTTWLLVVILAGQIGAAVWWFAKRKDVKAYAGIAPPPAAVPGPGWYADPSTGQQRWWDGQRWM